jgi:hypothetical protein
MGVRADWPPARVRPVPGSDQWVMELPREAREETAALSRAGGVLVSPGGSADPMGRATGISRVFGVLATAGRSHLAGRRVAGHWAWHAKQ